MASDRRLCFDDVYAEFHQRIRRYLDRLLGPSDGEDATQEVFVKVSRALPRFRGESSVSTWIYRVATNVAYDRLRSPSLRRAGEVPIDTATPAKDPSPDVERQLVRGEMNDCVDRFIDRLPANYRSVVILSEHEGLTNQEIAKALGLTVQTVKIRLHRARTRLKTELGDGCDFYRDERNELACDPKPNVVFLRRRPPTGSTSR
jgi:RNA polymerase sigma-70 factor (ECF subfamily)